MPTEQSVEDPCLYEIMTARSDEEALSSLHRLWEERIVDRVGAFLSSQRLDSETRHELEIETYLRVCHAIMRRRAHSSPLLSEPHPPSNDPSPNLATTLTTITDATGFALTSARSLLYNHFVDQNPSWRLLQLRVVAQLKRSERVARWKRQFRWIAGLSVWRDRAIGSYSPQAAEFLGGDYTRFRHTTLKNEEPKELSLLELMCHIFSWLASPLWQNHLIHHLAVLSEQRVTYPLSWEEMSEEGEQLAEQLWTESVEPGSVMRETVRHLLCESDLLSREERGALLLQMDLDTLTADFGLTLSAVAHALNLAPRQLFHETGRCRLPMRDQEIADLLGIQGTAKSTARQRVATYYRMSARRKLLPHLQ